MASERRIPRKKSVKQMVGGFFGHLLYIVRLVYQAKPAILFAMILLCIANGVLPVFGAYLSAGLLNEVATLIAGGQPLTNFTALIGTAVLTMLVTYFVFQFIQRLLGRISSMVNSLAGELVVNHIKLMIIEKAKEVDLSSFDRPEFYEKLENANREAGMRPLQILNAVFNLISTVISAISFVIILVGLHPLAPVVIVILAVPGAIVNYAFRRKNFWYMRHHSKERRQMNYFSGLMVNKDLVKEVRLMGTADTFIGKYKQAFAEYFKGIRRLILKEGFWQSVVTLLSLTANLLVFSYTVYHVLNANGAIGDYSLYTGALTSIAGCVTTIVSATATIYEGTLFIDNVMTFMQEPAHIVPTVDTPKIPSRRVPHTIEFRDVSFRYPGMDRDVLSHINLRFDHDEIVVLVGLNGAGKTTLIKLLTRLYDPTEGVILLDGVDIREYDVAELYQLYGIIFQDFGRYAMSVEDNIALGDVRREKNREDVIRAAKQGNVDDFVQKLADGYDSPLMRHFEDNGIELSGGQWQKLSVARAFYKESDILILDEPTSALDALAEQEVFHEFSQLSQNKIAVFVSHRLSSATMADKIVVIDGGVVTEVGSHAKLMAAKGTYYLLFTTQASRYRDDFAQ